MDFQQARERRGDPTAEATGAGRASTRQRAADARLRRAIREAFARQKVVPEGAEQPVTAPRLRAVGDERP